MKSDLASIRTHLDAEMASLREDIEALQKKQTYHETTASNAEQHLQKIKESIS